MRAVRAILGILTIVASIIPGGWECRLGVDAFRLVGFNFSSSARSDFEFFVLRGWQVYLPSLVFGALAFFMVFIGIRFLKSSLPDT